MDVLLYALGSLVLLAGVAAAASARVVKQIERGVVFRLGRAQQDLRRPGLAMLIPGGGPADAGQRAGGDHAGPPPG